MQQHWYAIYTNNKSELKLKNNIEIYSAAHNLGYRVYLPMTTAMRQLSDRKKTIKIPIFKNYLFVMHDESGFEKIKHLPGFGNYVRFGEYPAKIPEDEIDVIKLAAKNLNNIIIEKRF